MTRAEAKKVRDGDILELKRGKRGTVVFGTGLLLRFQNGRITGIFIRHGRCLSSTFPVRLNEVRIPLPTIKEFR